jgi:hypothetical protein
MGRRDSCYAKKKYFREYSRLRRARMGMKPRAVRTGAPEKPDRSLYVSDRKLYYTLYMRWWRHFGPVKDGASEWLT